MTSSFLVHVHSKIEPVSLTPDHPGNSWKLLAIPSADCNLDTIFGSLPLLVRPSKVAQESKWRNSSSLLVAREQMVQPGRFSWLLASSAGQQQVTCAKTA